MTSTILGATRTEQLASNIASLEVEIPAELRAKLDEASAIEPGNPYRFFEPMLQGMIRGGTDVRKWKAG